MTFTCHARTYRFVRMPFVICNAPSTCEWILDILLAGYKWKHCPLYVDDVISFGKTVEDHVRQVDEILTILEKARLPLTLKKCHFFPRLVDYFGHIIRPGLLELATKNLEGLKTAISPTTHTDVRSFFKICTFY